MPSELKRASVQTAHSKSRCTTGVREKLDCALLIVRGGVKVALGVNIFFNDLFLGSFRFLYA
jgi:hypothetical protein